MLQMKASGSRIPHLAWAIAEKQCIRRNAAYSTESQLHPLHRLTLVPQSCQRAFSQGAFPHRAQSSPHSLSRPQQVARPPHRPPPQKAEERPDYGFERTAPKQVFRSHGWYFYFACFSFVLMGAYTTSVYLSYRRDVDAYNKRVDKLQQNADVSDRWKNTTRNFDHEVECDEKVTFLKYKRRRLVRRAYGDVLEVSVGTGRNMDFYDTRPYDPTESASFGRSTRHMITSLTFNDQSEVMVDNAKKKWVAKQSERRKGDRFTGEVRYIVGDAGKPGVIPRPEGGYDTIIQSMGICSMADPVGFLKHLSALVRQPGEKIINSSPERHRKEEDDGKGGRIFLLEHGKAYPRWSWLNRYLDEGAPRHADRYGCWFNKDIQQVIDDSGLEVEQMKRYSFGTVWEIVLRPKPPSATQENATVQETSTQPRRSWWTNIWG